MNLTQVDEAVLKSIREVIDNTPVCEHCGGDADECGCAEFAEDEDQTLSEPSGDKEEIVINPELDMFSASSQQKVDEWSRAAKDGYLTEMTHAQQIKLMKSTLANDEESSDEEIVAYWIGAGIPKSEAMLWIKKRNGYLASGGMNESAQKKTLNEAAPKVEFDAKEDKTTVTLPDSGISVTMAGKVGYKVATAFAFYQAKGQRRGSHIDATSQDAGKWFYKNSNRQAAWAMQDRRSRVGESTLTEGIRAFKSGGDPELQSYLDKHVIRSKWRKSADARKHANMFDGATVIRVGDGDSAYFLMVQPKDTSKNHENNPHHDTLMKHGFKHTGTEAKGMGNLTQVTHSYSHPAKGDVKVNHLGDGYAWTNNGKRGYTDKALKGHLGDKS